MAAGERDAGSASSGLFMRVPRWWKLASGFLAGGALVAASLTIVLPRGLAGLLKDQGFSALSTGEGEILPGEPGSAEEFYVDESGQLRRRTVAGGGGPQAATAQAGQAGTTGRAGGASGGRTNVGGGTSGGATGGGSGGSGQCSRTGNGGATDFGVSATKINLATTAVLDGPAASLLRDSVTGMKAVMDKVNKSGGICGRLLELKVDNDQFRADTGQSYIKSYIDSKSYFALPVVPSAEGLGSSILSGDIAAAGIPVVGTDGMRKEQYDAGGKAAWVWPVAAATVSTMRAMVKYGREVKGAQTFAIVYDSKYQFGIEGKDAFLSQVPADKVIKVQPLDPAQDSYASEVESFNNACGGDKCDMVALLLLPDAAEKWFARNPVLGRLFTSGAQTLFTDRVGQKCVQAMRERCHGIFAWTGYNPPIGALANKTGVATYTNDVRAIDPGLVQNGGHRNQFVQGAYLGMSVFVEGLKKTGPTLTRAGLRQVLDSMDYPTDLSATLSWRPGNHWANVQAQGFSMNVTQGQFNGWAKQTDWVRDPDH